MSLGYNTPAFPLSPSRARKPRTKEPLTETFVFRRGAAEKAELRAKAEAAGLPAATLLREAFGLTEARRRKRIPRVDLALVLAECVDLDARMVARRLLTIERQLAQIMEVSCRY